MKAKVGLFVALATHFTMLLSARRAEALLIVETFESFASGTDMTSQLAGLTITAFNGGTPRIATATSPTVPGQPQGLYNDAPGVFLTGFEFPLLVDFSSGTSTVGAIVDFGVVGAGLQLIAYSGFGGGGAILGSVSTLTEQFISVNAAGIHSAIFQQADTTHPPSWLIDNLTYDQQVHVTPEPASAVLLGLALTVIGLRASRRNSPK